MKIQIVEYLKMRYTGHSHLLSEVTTSHLPGGKATFATIAVAIAVIVLSYSSVAYAIQSELTEKELLQRLTESNLKLANLEKVVIHCLSNKPIAVDGIAFECTTASLGVAVR